MTQRIAYSTRRIWPEAREQLERVASVASWDAPHPIPRKELLIRVKDADALLCTSEDRIDREVIAAGRRLRIISTMSSTVDHIDLAAAYEHGVVVTHTPGVADEAIADMTMALLLACARNIVEADSFVKHREWQHWSPELFLGADVQGNTIGIIGLDHIGLRVAQRALGFGMRVLYYDTQRNTDAEQRLGIQYGELNAVLQEADFVTLHVPLLPMTTGLIDEKRLRMMKPSAFLINVAHGSVVDHNALVRALREGWIAGAGLDVFEEEPIPADDPLLDLPNVVLIPHIGANTYDGIGTMMRMAVKQVIDVLEEREPSNRVMPRGKAA